TARAATLAGAPAPRGQRTSARGSKTRCLQPPAASPRTSINPASRSSARILRMSASAASRETSYAATNASITGPSPDAGKARQMHRPVSFRLYICCVSGSRSTSSFPRSVSITRATRAYVTATVGLRNSSTATSLPRSPSSDPRDTRSEKNGRVTSPAQRPNHVFPSVIRRTRGPPGILDGGCAVCKPATVDAFAPPLGRAPCSEPPIGGPTLAPATDRAGLRQRRPVLDGRAAARPLDADHPDHRDREDRVRV